MSLTTVPNGVGAGDLPGELTDHIFDFIQDDTDSLKACTLVSQAWTPYSQGRLFSTLTCYPNKPGKTVEEVVAWATSADGTRVCGYVKTLIVRRSLEAFSVWPTLRVADFELLMHHMPNVHYITLREMAIASMASAPPSASPPASNIRPLDKLVILSCTTNDDTFQSICNLMGLFPAIDRLQLLGSVCYLKAPLQSTPWFTHLLGNLRVRELDLSAGDRKSSKDHTTLCNTFQRVDPPWPLRRLGLSFPYMLQNGPLSNFLSRCTESLLDLRVDVVQTMSNPVLRSAPDLPAQSSQWRTPILKECTQLKILRLNFHSIGYVCVYRSWHEEVALRAEYNHILHANAELVLSAPSGVETIIITFFHHGRRDDRIDAIRHLSAWHRLDAAFQSLRYLKSVICIIPECIVTESDTLVDSEVQIELLWNLPQSSRPWYQLVSPTSSAEEYAAVIAHGLPATSSAGRLRILAAVSCRERKM